MSRKKMSGLVIAMPTPLKVNEDVDLESACNLMDYSINEGVSGLMLAGTMGEGTALLDSQKKLLIENAVNHINGRVPVLATISASSTRQTVESMKMIESVGVDYLVLTTPFYYKYPDPESLIVHIKRISENTDIPIVFYNAPGCTGNPVTADTLDEILNISNVAGIKDSSCNYNNFMELLRRYPDKGTRPGFIMQADESMFDSSLIMGVDGIVSGGGVLFIKDLLALIEAGFNGDKAKVMELQIQFSEKLLGLLKPNIARDWMFKIKKELVQRGIISEANVTEPFLR